MLAVITIAGILLTCFLIGAIAAVVEHRLHRIKTIKTSKGQTHTSWH